MFFKIVLKFSNKAPFPLEEYYFAVIVTISMRHLKLWWETFPAQSKNILDLTSYYNKKYGNFPKGSNERNFDNSFVQTFANILKPINFQKVIIVGANCGDEVGFVLNQNPYSEITAVDISDEALQKLQNTYPKVKIIHADIESYFTNEIFDLYICCRTIMSSNILEPEKIIQYALKIAKNVIFSVSCSYREGEKIIYGMYNYSKKCIDTDLPTKKSLEVPDVFSMNSRKFDTKSCTSEIFIYTK